KMGYEIILNFIIHFKNYINLKPPSYGYFISSSHTDLLKLRNSIEGYNLYLEELSKKHIFFEDIILNRIKIAKV
ncbi:MAG: hypothetical protein ACFFKA_06805, partial [Candidatus Thorarchaeota archaeon]